MSVAHHGNQQFISQWKKIWCEISGGLAKNRSLKNIMLGCIFKTGLGFWDLVKSISKGGGGTKRGKTLNQEDFKMALGPNIFRNCSNNIPYCRAYISCSYRAFDDIFSVNIGQDTLISNYFHSDSVS